MEFWLSFLPIVIYLLLIVILIIGIILGIQSINAMKKVNKVVDDVNNKVESLNGLFSLIDYTTDKLSTFSDMLVEGVSGIISKLFHRKKKKEEEYDE